MQITREKDWADSQDHVAILLQGAAASLNDSTIDSISLDYFTHLKSWENSIFLRRNFTVYRGWEAGIQERDVGSQLSQENFQTCVRIRPHWTSIAMIIHCDNFPILLEIIPIRVLLRGRFQKHIFLSISLSITYCPFSKASKLRLSLIISILFILIYHIASSIINGWHGFWDRNACFPT